MERHDLLLLIIPHQELASQDTMSLELAPAGCQTEALCDTLVESSFDLGSNHGRS
jgi:hypothetical protein